MVYKRIQILVWSTITFFVLVIVSIVSCCLCFSAEWIRVDNHTEWMDADDYFDNFAPADIRQAYYNPSGSCVYFSVSFAALNQNDPNAQALPWNIPVYGPPCRGGCYPSRLIADFNRRGIKGESIVGDRTLERAKKALAQGKFVALGLSTAHFQVGIDHEPDTQRWHIWNCNDYHKIYRYSNQRFMQLHQASGLWYVILKNPVRPMPPTHIIKWE